MPATRDDKVRPQLFSHMGDMDIQKVGEGVVVFVEQVLVQFSPADDLAQP